MIFMKLSVAVGFYLLMGNAIVQAQPTAQREKRKALMNEQQGFM